MDEMQMADGPRVVADYAAVGRRRWWIIAAAIVVGIVAGVALSLVQSKVYESSTSVLVEATTAVDTTQPTGARTNSGINLDTEAQLVKSELVAIRTKALLRSPAQVLDLLQQLNVTVPPNTDVLVVTFKAPTPKAAQAGSHAFAQAYLDQRRANAKTDLDGQIASLTAIKNTLDAQLKAVSGQVAALPANSAEREKAQAEQGILSNQIQQIGAKLSPLQAAESQITPGNVINDANLPTSPSKPNLYINLGSALFAGLLLGLALALLAERRDGRLHEASEVRAQTDLPVLVEVPHRELTPTLAGRSMPAARYYGRLRNAVLSVLAKQPRTAPGGQARSNVVLMLGASPGHGPGVVAANLCAALVRPGNPVSLLCADPQSSSPAVLGVTGTRGLSDLLRSDADIGDVQQPSPLCPGVYVVVPGTNADADELVPERLASIVDALLAYSEYLIIETRPARRSAEGQALAGLAQMSFVVLELRKSRREDVGEVVRQFDQVGAPLAGVVVVPEVKRPPVTLQASTDAAGRTPAPGPARPGTQGPRPSPGVRPDSPARVGPTPRP
jgi:succinoglycan biosynthesis transport protein ExoP